MKKFKLVNMKSTANMLLISAVLSGVFMNSALAAAKTAEQQEELNKRVKEAQDQSIEYAKAISEAQGQVQLEIERAKIQAQREARLQEQSPLMNSSQKDFTSSVVINPPNERKDIKRANFQSEARNTAKSRVATKYEELPVPNYQLPTKANGKELTKDEMELLLNAYRIKNLQALQKPFFKYDYDNGSNLMYALEQKEHTIKINTRYATTTTIIFDFPIENYILGDNTGFEINELPNMDNALNIRPLIIGIDTNLTVFTKDKRIYSIYLFSTDYKSNELPKFIVNVKTPYTKEEIEQEALAREHRKKELDRREWLVIQEGPDRIKIKRDEIDRRYVQKAKKKYRNLLARNIFSDKQYTFFEYDRDLTPEIPAAWVVIDGQDSPVASRVLGNYLIVESIADKFTIRAGDAYVCVRKKR